ncbi:MAG: diguanylate cyclase, partial [Lachnospiraceae bacterium]|nr:diguanylate cyclase [Lachnospiraceae bacterium]
MDIGLYRSEIQKLIQDIQESRGKDPKRTIASCKELEQYGLSQNDNALIGFARFSLGETYYLMNDTASFYREMIMCLEPLKAIKEWGYLTMANNMLGIMSLNRGNAPFAMDYYMQAIHYCQEYRLPDLEWVVHMNLGNLYLNIGDPDSAIESFENGYQYINNHPDSENYISTLTAACVGLGKAYLDMGEVNVADEFNHRLIRECMPKLVPMEKLVVYCFEARLYCEQGRNEECKKCISLIKENFDEVVPVLDVFDDFYDYLKMLLSMELYDEFMEIMSLMEPSTKRTGIRNLEKKLLILKMKRFKAIGDEESYAKGAKKYFELDQLMDQETGMMISNTIELRSRLNELANITREVEIANRALQMKSETDALTGMHNRLKLSEYADEAFYRSVQNGVGFAIEILDIDYFKEFNDNYGHQAGDKCIRFVANAIMSLQSHDGVFCARYGGDEFVVIYEGYTDKEVFAIAKELKEMIFKAEFEHKYTKLSHKILTISQGIYWSVPEHGQSPWNYLHAADSLLYKVKKRSRNSIMLG